MRNPWEVDWSDPAQVQQMTQRPRIQGPPRQPPPRYPDEVARAESAEARARAAEERAAAAARMSAETHALQMRPNPATTEGGRLSRAFYERALRANEGYGQGVPPRNPIAQTLVDVLPENLERSVSSSPRRTADTFADEFIAATLRRESGAAIPEPEREAQRRRYFPMPGDTEEQFRVKAELRQNALDALYVQAFGEMPQRPTPQEGAPPPTIGAAPDRQTTAPQRTMAPGAGGQMELSNETQTRANPALAGLNTRVGQMIQQQRPIGTIVRYLRERGVSGPNLQALSTEIRRIRAWQRQNPTYRGPITVDLERYDVPLDPVTSTLASAADTGPGAAGGSYIDTATGQRLDSIAGALGGDAEAVNAGIGEIRRRHPIASTIGDIGAGVSLYGAGRAVAGRALGGALPTTARTFGPGAMAGDAALGAYIGSGQGTDWFNPEGAALGAAAGTGGGVLGRGGINTLGRAVSPTGGRMAPLYAEGVQPTIGQRVGGAADRFEQAITSVPGVGAIPRRARNEAVEQFETGAFNQALREIGTQLPQNARFGTKAHDYMQRAFNVAFRRIRSRSQFVRDGDFDNDLVTIRSDVGLLDDASQSHFERIVANELEGRLTRTGGTLRGADYVKVASRLDRVARNLRRNPNADPSLAEAFDELSSAMDRAAARHSAPGLAESLAATRRGYQRAVVIEDAARRRGSGVGRFSPTQLDAAVQNIGGGLRSRAYLRGDAPMQEYATTGLNLGDTLANSGTVDRILASGAVGSAGYANPWLLAPMGANLALTAPGIRKGVNAVLAPNRPGMMGLRSQIQNRAYLGGLAGLPLIPQQ